MAGPPCAAFASAGGALHPSLDPGNGVVAMGGLLPPAAAVALGAALLPSGKTPIYDTDGADLAPPSAAGQALALVNSPHELRHCCGHGPPR